VDLRHRAEELETEEHALTDIDGARILVTRGAGLGSTTISRACLEPGCRGSRSERKRAWATAGHVKRALKDLRLNLVQCDICDVDTVTRVTRGVGFEREFAAPVGALHACALSNRTTTLHLALLVARVMAGYEGVTVNQSRIATANSTGDRAGASHNA